MKNKQALFILIALFFWIPCVEALTAPAAPATPAGFPQMDEKMEAEVKKFEEDFGKLSKEEQESFFKSMEEAVQKIDELSKTEEGKKLLDKLDKGDITDEELDQLINQIAPDIQEPEAPQEPVQEPVEKPKESTPKPVLSSKHEQAIDTINSIIAHTTAFIVKAATVPDLPNKVKKWERSRLLEWHAGLTWNKLKSDIEQLVSQLGVLLEKDQKTKEYYHLDELLKEESLYNNIKKIQAVVAQYEPRIEEMTPLQNSLSKESKKSFQKMINQYIEALYTLNIVTELKQLFTKFSPKAKISREEEEQAFKKAEIEGKKKLMPGSPITAGTPESKYMPSKSSYSRSPGSRAGGYQGYGSSYKEPSYGFPGPKEQPRKAAANGKRKSSKAKKAGDEEEKEGKTDKDKSKDKDKTEKPVDKFATLRKQAAKQDEKMVKEADKLLEKVKDNISSAASIIKKTAFFTNIEQHLMDVNDVDFEVITETIPDLIRELSVRRGALGNIEQLHRKLTNPVGRKKYQEKLKKMLNEHKSLEELLNQLNAIEAKWPTFINSIPKFKLFAYFGEQEEVQSPQEENDVDKTLQEIEKTSQSVEEGLEKAVEYLQKRKPTDAKLAEVQQKVSAPISLFELKKNIAALKDAIDKFDQSKPKE